MKFSKFTSFICKLSGYVTVAYFVIDVMKKVSRLLQQIAH